MSITDSRSIKKLSELNLEIQSVIHGHFPESMWIIAEISEIKINSAGHCYLELIEKDQSADKIKARARATIWSFAFRMLKPYFESATGYELKQGIKILVSIKVEFHEVYGYSLNITDIDPTYTLGDIERKRQEIITRLQKEGVFNMNRDLALSAVPQKIAVISSETAAGYEDFINQLDNNPFGYIFYHQLFPGIMQGEQAESSIIQAFESIFKYSDFFDAVVIIRGGGSKSDLAAFDNYNIAYYITQFPVPVLTGIGHEQDETIADMVAHTRLKTPTAAAGFLIDRVSEFEQILVQSKLKLERLSDALLNQYHKNLNSIQQQVISLVSIRMQYHSDRLGRFFDKLRSATTSFMAKLNLQNQHYIRNFFPAVKNRLSYHSMILENLILSLSSKIDKMLEMNKKHLDLLYQRNMDMDPRKILERGYSITLFDGKPLKNSNRVRKGNIIETQLNEGKIASEIREIAG
jgi:exodeoxyribonuclease VII large subunit